VAPIRRNCQSRAGGVEMRQQVTKELFAYWDGLRNGRPAPDRSEIDPSAIRHLLADSFIIEIDPEQREFPLRLCGARLNSLWLCEQTGRSFLHLWREQDRTNAAAALMTAVEGGTPIVGSVSGEGVEFELLLLPLLHFGRPRQRIMGSLSMPRQPVWFGQRAMEPLTLKCLRVMDDVKPVRLAAPAKPLNREVTMSQAPRLVVYQGGKSRYR
jgi:hypothetical protein